MLISLLLSACTTADSSWSTDDLFGPAGSSGHTTGTQASVSDPRFPTAEELEALDADPSSSFQQMLQSTSHRGERQSPISPIIMTHSLVRMVENEG